MPRRYNRPLYILPFDHRGSFQARLFGWTPPLSDAQTAEIAGAKQVIYEKAQIRSTPRPSDRARAEYRQEA